MSQENVEVVRQLFEAADRGDAEIGDDRVAVMFRLIAKGRASGVTLDRAVGAVHRLLEGKLWRIRSYLDPREALEAAGLSE